MYQINNDYHYKGLFLNSVEVDSGIFLLLEGRLKGRPLGELKKIITVGKGLIISYKLMYPKILITIDKSKKENIKFAEHLGFIETEYKHENFTIYIQ